MSTIGSPGTLFSSPGASVVIGHPDLLSMMKLCSLHATIITRVDFGKLKFKGDQNTPKLQTSIPKACSTVILQDDR